jgi:tRNA-dihydrouridine synthase
MNPVPTSFETCRPEIHFAPLQGYTDMAYYSAFSCCFPHVDFFYTPYFSIDDNLSPKIKNIPQLISKQIVAQVLPKDVHELKRLLKYVVENNFAEINLNLGCPYPMVTNKQRGAGLIQHRKVVADMIDYILDHSSLQISVKTRLGLKSEDEILQLLDTIASKKLKSIIVHPRTAVQLYKGDVSLPMYKKCKTLFPTIDFIYNGDITSVAVFNEVQASLNGQQKWMIGRGLLSNPFLAEQVKGIFYTDAEAKKRHLYKFILKLIEETERDSKNNGHLLNRLKTQFHYLSDAFPEPIKTGRLVKKIKSIEGFEGFLMTNL